MIKVENFLKKLYDSHLLSALVVVAATLIAIYPVFSFFFWHDDFSVFYRVRLGVCTIGWPYNTYCFIFSSLSHLFGYNPIYYFSLDVLFGVIASLAFLFFSKVMFGNKVAFWISLIFSTFYIGAGVFQEAYDPIVSFLTLSLLFISLGLILMSIRKGLILKTFMIGLIVLAISIIAYPARSSTNFLMAIALIVLFAKKIKVRTVFLMVFAVVITNILFFYFIPKHLSSSQPVVSSASSSSFLNINVPQKASYALESIGSVIVTDNFSPSDQVRITASIVFFIYIFYVALKDKNRRSVALYSAFWMVAGYAPYGLRSDWRIWDTYRYMIFVFPGILFFLTLFSKYKKWIYLCMFVFIFYLIQTHNFLVSNELVSVQRRDFYNQLLSQLPNFPDKSVLYFNFPKSIANAANDFFRVGETPSESSLGEMYTKNYNDLTLITDSDVLLQAFESKDFQVEKFFSFFYDGNNLTNTTNEAREMLKGFNISAILNSKSTTNFIEDKGMSSGSIGKEAFLVKDFLPITPSKVSLSLTAKTLDFPIPYTQDCVGQCNYANDLLKKVFSFTTYNRDLKSKTIVSTSINAEGTLAVNLIDGYKDNFWMDDRPDWFSGKKPVIDIRFKIKTKLSGLVVWMNNPTHSVSDFNIIADNKKIKFSKKDCGKGCISILFGDSLLVNQISIIPTETNGDTPLINEIDFLPADFEGFEFNKIDDILAHPAANINTTDNKALLNNYLASGVSACLEWENLYGKSYKEFILKADGKPHTYNIVLPSFGIKPLAFHVGCINYPLDLSLEKVNISNINQ